MSKLLQIGSDVFPYPDAGENPGWGEDQSAWAEAVTDALGSVQGPNDVLIQSFSLSNNQTSATNIVGLVFNTGEVQGIEVDYLIIRTYDSGSTVDTDRGKIVGDFNGTVFSIAHQSTNDVGVALTITNAGQFQYTSSNLAGHVSSIIRFRAKTIDIP